MTQVTFLEDGSVAPLGSRHAVGPYFELWEVELPERGACLLKVPRGDYGAEPLYQARRSVIFSRLWSVHTTASVSATTLEVLERLLEVQARRIQESRGTWNLELLGSGAVEIEGRGETYGLWMPRYAGEALGAMDRGRQRALFPRMLPALWDALAAAPHLDLSPDNLWIDAARGRFVLLDPGVMLVEYESGAMVRTQAHIVTNADHYPILGPHLPVLAEPGFDLARAYRMSVHVFQGIQGSGATQIVPETLSVPRSGVGVYAADLHALGIMYFGILTGEHPYDEVSPVWENAQAWNNPSEPWGEGLERGRRLSEQAAPSAAALASDVTPGEEVLARALLELRVGSRSELLAAMAPLARETR